jgi:hypothetical protein
MTTTEDRFMLDVLADGHDRLLSSLEVAAKVYTLLPDGVTLRALTVLPHEVAGEVSSLDDKTAIGRVVWISQMPHWRFEKSQHWDSEFLTKPYATVSAMTDMDGIPVRIWAHVAADEQQVTADSQETTTETAVEEVEAA